MVVCKFLPTCNVAGKKQNEDAHSCDVQSTRQGVSSRYPNSEKCEMQPSIYIFF